MQKELIILDGDKAWARARIAELEKTIQELGSEFYEVFNQSSETWHDNAPFDALRDRQSVLDAELQQLKRIMSQSLPGQPPRKKGVVTVGNEVVLESGRGKRRHYFIAGDWTPYPGQQKGLATVVSAGAPLAVQLLGKRLEAEVKIGREIFAVKEIH